MMNHHTPRVLKEIVENSILSKFSYAAIPVILTHHKNLVQKSERGVKSRLFSMKSFDEQKYQVSLIQRSITLVLDKFLSE